MYRAFTPKIAKDYTQAGAAIEVPWYNIADLAAGGLWSTPSDLAKFIAEIQKAHQSKSELLSLKMVEEMLIPYQESFGLGLKVGGEGAVIMKNSDNGWLLAIEILKRIGIVYQWPIEAPQRF